MMKRLYLYMALIAAAGLTACTDSEGVTSNSGDKTPIELAASLSATGTTSRAVNATFEVNDKVVVGLRNSGSSDYSSPYFKRTEFTAADATANLTSPVLYWDDFSTSTYELKEGSTYKLNVLYGICLNGGSATITDAGTFDWTTITDQFTNTTKTSDLLLANTLNQVAYSRTADKVVRIPFSHAMSEVTINLTAADGYSASTANFTNTTMTLKSMNSKCSVDAANLTTPLTNIGTPLAEVKMYKATPTNTKATYQAIVVPGTTLAANQTLATITDVNGNNYDIVLSDAILGDAATTGTWKNNLDGGKMKPGVNYVLNVTLKKQAMSIVATVADWSTASAEATGEIKFTADGTTQGTAGATAFTKAFTVYSNSAATDAGYTAGSTFTYSRTSYSTTTPMYWAGNTDSRYFRTAIYNSSTESTVAPVTITDGQATGILSEVYSDAKDILWGTSGSTIYNPTTAAVKMNFYHALAKVKVVLATSAATDADYVDLTKVDHISISDVHTGGVLSLHNGTVAPTATVGTLTISGANTDYLVIPQTIGDTSKLIVTMKDGTTYSVNMNSDTGLKATAWTGGTYYTYTVTIKKSAVTFSAQVKAWDTATGSGNATMDWD